MLNNKIKIMKKRYYLYIAIALIAIGFFTGRWTIKNPEPKIEYVELPAIKDSLNESDLRPISEDLRDSIVYITVYKEIPVIIKQQLSDTVIRYVTVIDTLESLKKTAEDWNIVRTYNNNLFDNSEVGKFDYTAKVQFNKLIGFSYNFIPIQKVETIVKPSPKIKPFISASYSSFRQVTLGGGIYINSIGIRAFYVNDILYKRNGLGIGVSYRF